MPTFRHFVAVGVGATLVLSIVEPSAAKELPSLTPESRNLSGEGNTQPPGAATQEQLPASISLGEEQAQRVHRKNSSSTSSATPASSASDASRFTEEPNAEAKLEVDKLSQSIVTSNSLEGSRSTHSQSIRSAVDANSNQPVVNPIRGRGTRKKGDATPEAQTQAGEDAQRLDIRSEPSPRVGASPPLATSHRLLAVKPAEKKQMSSVPAPGVTVLPVAALAPQRLQESSLSAEAVIGQPTPKLDGASLAQSPRSPIRNAPPPDFLNPSPNPLLFPTRSEEVQVRTTQPITLQQAIELARRNNRTLEEAQLTLERNQAALQEALAAEFPTIGVNAQFSRNDSASQRLQAARAANNPFSQVPDTTISETFNAVLQVEYDLFTAGRRPAQIRQAEERIRLQQLEVERTAEQLRLDVSSAYYDLQGADAQVDISQAAVTEAAQSLRDAQLLEQAGLGTRFDVLQAQVRLSEANQDLIRALSRQRIARRQLTQLLSLSQTVEVTTADPIETAGDWTLSLEQTIVLALKNRAELEQQLTQREIGEQERRIALSAIRPQASLSASYNILGVLNDQLGPTTGLSLGATLRWNFFDGGAARARAQQARTNIAIAESRFADQRNQIRLEVERAFFELNANAKNIQTATFALQQAEESLRLARLRFQAGVGTQTDVINQQTALTRARVNRLTAILDYNRALAQLQRATSNLPNSNLGKLP